MLLQPPICSERISAVRIDQIALLGQMSHHAVWLSDTCCRRRSGRVIICIQIGRLSGEAIEGWAARVTSAMGAVSSRVTSAIAAGCPAL
jgi:hypothetical protein